ncbi:MAG: DUF429 domain-containing protein [Planctomycetota bacterium]
MAEPLRSTGLDWATEPKNRALVVVEATPGAGVRIVEVCSAKLDEAEIVRRANDAACGVLAVDIPFGWPQDFSSFVSAWSPSQGAKALPSLDAFRYRYTDLEVRRHYKKSPLSVAADRIALGARKWAEIVQGQTWGPRVDVIGGRRGPPAPIVEVYPAASVLAFGESVAGYKNDEVVRERLVDALCRRLNVQVSRADRAALVSAGKDSDRTDAFVAALTGLAYLGALEGWEVRLPPAEKKSQVEKEGWIFVPCPRDAGSA